MDTDILSVVVTPTVCGQTMKEEYITFAYLYSSKILEPVLVHVCDAVRPDVQERTIVNGCYHGYTRTFAPFRNSVGVKVFVRWLLNATWQTLDSDRLVDVVVST